MGKIAVGTCGYSYTDWIGPVYPEGTKQARMLSLYSDLFNTLELNFTYYRMPTAEQLARMAEQTPRGFTFSVKAHESLTHKIDLLGWEKSAKTYLEALSPLREQGRLEAVLLQFPYSFHYEPDNRRYLDRLLGFFEGIPIAVEFRGIDWFNNRAIEAFRQRGIPLTDLDMPELPELPPALEVVTGPFAYIRLHGRNRETWWGSDAAARYDYLYTEKELEAWVDRIRRIEIKADTVLVYFNNHRRGQAVQNAQTLIKLLFHADDSPS